MIQKLEILGCTMGFLTHEVEIGIHQYSYRARLILNNELVAMVGKLKEDRLEISYSYPRAFSFALFVDRARLMRGDWVSFPGNSVFYVINEISFGRPAHSLCILTKGDTVSIVNGKLELSRQVVDNSHDPMVVFTRIEFDEGRKVNPNNPMQTYLMERFQKEIPRKE